MRKKLIKRNSLKDSDLPIKNVKFYLDDRGCHVCTSHSTKSTGYPRMRHPITKNMSPVQQVIYEKHHGLIPEDKVVTRSCGNKRCLNPDHLLLRDKKKTLQYLGILLPDRPSVM